MRPGGWRHLWALEGAGAGSGKPTTAETGPDGAAVCRGEAGGARGASQGAPTPPGDQMDVK